MPLRACAAVTRPSCRMSRSVSCLCRDRGRRRVRTSAAPPWSFSLQTTHWPGRGTPLRCAGRARSPRGTRGSPPWGGPLRCATGGARAATGGVRQASLRLARPRHSGRRVGYGRARHSPACGACGRRLDGARQNRACLVGFCGERAHAGAGWTAHGNAVCRLLAACLPPAAARVSHPQCRSPVPWMPLFSHVPWPSILRPLSCQACAIMHPLA